VYEALQTRRKEFPVNQKGWLAGLFVFILVTAAIPARAGEQPAAAGEKTPDALDHLMLEGWIPMADGVLQRFSNNTRVETLALGVAGFEWRVGQLTDKVHQIEQRLKLEPNPELDRALQSYRDELAATLRDLEEIRMADSLGRQTLLATASGCTVTYTYNASAFPLTTTQGAGASANASFSSTCADTGTVTAHAMAQATANNVTTTIVDAPLAKAGNPASITASASVNGNVNCSSEADASVSSTTQQINKSIQQTNALCPNDLAVSISGLNAIVVPCRQCSSVTWTATDRGGVSPLGTISWTANGAAAGSGTSISRTFCNLGGTAGSSTLALAAAVSDAVGNKATGTLSFTATNSTSCTTCLKPPCCLRPPCPPL
jgi:hypothetical protein